MTAATLEELRDELKRKIEIERPALAARLKSAIELGDLTENAEYQSAKEEQGFLEGRIQELQEMINGAVIIEDNSSLCAETVQLGCRVTVVEDGQDQAETFLIVGKVEANPREGKISNESPLGSALIGRKVGDIVRIATPEGEVVFTITQIE